MKRILIILAVLFYAVVGRADTDDCVLYWLVEPNDTPEFYYAMIKFGVDSDGSTLTGESVYADNFFIGFEDHDIYIGDSRPDVMYAKNAANLTGVMHDLNEQGVTVTDVTQLRFMVELYNYSEEVSYTSGLYDVSALANYIGFWSEFSAGWTSVDALAITPFSAPVPEPCGGVLLLIGGALLVLRRRRNAFRHCEERGMSDAAISLGHPESCPKNCS